MINGIDMCIFMKEKMFIASQHVMQNKRKWYFNKGDHLLCRNFFQYLL